MRLTAQMTMCMMWVTGEGGPLRWKGRCGMAAAIEIMERFDGGGVAKAWVVAGLPAGYYYEIKRNAQGNYESKSKNGSKPSIRYGLHVSLDDAYRLMVAWAKRRQREFDRVNLKGGG